MKLLCFSIAVIFSYQSRVLQWCLPYHYCTLNGRIAQCHVETSVTPTITAELVKLCILAQGVKKCCLNDTPFIYRFATEQFLGGADLCHRCLTRN